MGSVVNQNPESRNVALILFSGGQDVPFLCLRQFKMNTLNSYMFQCVVASFRQKFHQQQLKSQSLPHSRKYH